jgi:hypothetical protein
VRPCAPSQVNGCTVDGHEDASNRIRSSEGQVVLKLIDVPLTPVRTSVDPGSSRTASRGGTRGNARVLSQRGAVSPRYLQYL